MADSTKITFDADASKYLAEAKKKEQAHERELQQLQRLMKANKEAATEEKKLRREVAAAVEAARTPAEAYYKTIEKYKSSLASGMITEKEYNRIRDAALVKLNDSKRAIDSQSDAIMRQKQAIVEAANAQREAAREEVRLRQEVSRAIDAARAPSEVYEATIRKYTDALMQGMLTSSQFNRLRDVELQKLHSTTKAMDDNADAAKRVSKETEDASTSEGLFSAVVSRTATAAVAAAVALSQLADAKKKVRKENEGDVFSIDEASRSYAIQAGLRTDKERIAKRDEILQIAQANAVTPQDAFGTATQLLGSGVEDPRALDFFLKLRAGANEQLGKSDPRALIEGMSQFLGGMGAEKSFANFEDVGQRIRGLFQNPESAAVQVQDLSDFAKAAPAFALTKTSTQDALSMLAVLRGGMPSAAEASTGARAVVTRLAASGATKTGEDALASMGLKPADVDMVGENLMTVLRTLKKASDKMAPEARNVALTRLFGSENLGAGVLAIENVDKMERIGRSQINREAFDAGAEMAMTGRAADMRRAKVAAARTAVQFEDDIATKAVVDEEVKRLRTEKQLGRRDSVIGAAQTLLETGVTLPMVGQIGTNRLEDVASELGAMDQKKRLEKAGQSSFWLPSFIPGTFLPTPSTFSLQSATSPENQKRAEQVVKGSGVDPLMVEQNNVLKDIRDQKPAPMPAPDPRLKGRVN